MNLDTLLNDLEQNKDSLVSHVGTEEFPDTVKGRVAHIDADFLAYIAAAEKVGEESTKQLKDCVEHLKEMVETFRLLAGAETTVLHLTPSGSTKGNRYKQAVLKEYQANRKDKPKPRYLHLVRDYMIDNMGAIGYTNLEADDGMAAAQWKAYLAGDKDKSIIVSKDKDLRIIPGLHLDWDTGDITENDVTGALELRDTKSGKKLFGFGGMWFFAQMLMGDSADNISGCPVLHRDLLNGLFPTAAISKAIETLRNPKSTDKQRESAAKKLMERNHKKIGPVVAYDLLKDCKTLKEAYKVVVACYKYAEKAEALVSYKTGKNVSWEVAFVSETQLLWMRRNEDPADGIHFIKEYCK